MERRVTKKGKIRYGSPMLKRLIKRLEETPDNEFRITNLHQCVIGHAMVLTQALTRPEAYDALGLRRNEGKKVDFGWWSSNVRPTRLDAIAMLKRARLTGVVSWDKEDEW